VFYKFTKAKNSYEFERFLTRLLTNFKGRKIYLILDNARYHTSRKIQAWLAKQEDKIEFVFLPKQAPWLNPIEPVWEDFKNDRIRNRHFTSMKQIISVSRGYFKHRGQKAAEKAVA